MEMVVKRCHTGQGERRVFIDMQLSYSYSILNLTGTIYFNLTQTLSFMGRFVDIIYSFNTIYKIVKLRNIKLQSRYNYFF